MTSATRPTTSPTAGAPEWSILAQALALQESGILVQGMSVTDLSTGFCVEGPPEAMSPDYFLVEPEARAGKHSLGEDIALWGTQISVARLGELTVLLDEVVQQREENPDAASVNPKTPRETFPWGIGLDVVDVLVAGAHARIIAAYLRVMGYRARVVDENEALHIAAELTATPQPLDAPSPPSAAHHPSGLSNVADARSNDTHLALHASDPVDYASDHLAHHDSDHPTDVVSSQFATQQRESGALKALIAVALVVVVVGVGVTVASFVVGRETPGEDVVAEGVASTGENHLSQGDAAGPPEASIPTPRSSDPALPREKERDSQRRGGAAPRDKFEEPHKMGGKREAHAPRADVPVAVGVAGWKRVGSTKGREEYRSSDDGMRVLLAAKPTPLRRQEELDQAVLRALEKAQGVQVVRQSPVVYEEKYPGSATQWHVVLRDGHQLSIGCQVREHTPSRQDQCRKIVRAAHPE